MIFLKEFNILIDEPIQFNNLPVGQKNHIVNVLDKGEIFFKMPKDFNQDKNESKHKNNYKIGFIYDLLTIVYPAMSKIDKYTIIQNEYHFFLTPRRFRDILKEYENNKRKYYKNRSLL